MDVVRFYDKTSWTRETFPKHLTFDMQCDNEIRTLRYFEKNGDDCFLDASHPVTKRLEADGIIIRQSRSPYPSDERYHYILNKQIDLGI